MAAVDVWGKPANATSNQELAVLTMKTEEQAQRLLQVGVFLFGPKLRYTSERSTFFLALTLSAAAKSCVSTSLGARATLFFWRMPRVPAARPRPTQIG